MNLIMNKDLEVIRNCLIIAMMINSFSHMNGMNICRHRTEMYQKETSE